MTNINATGSVKRTQIEATIIRADGTREELGVIADSSRRWRFGPGRWFARRRIRRANARAG